MTLLQASLWPSVPLVVHQSMLGTALGIMTSVQMIGIGLCNFAIGGILDHWKYVLSVLSAFVTSDWFM